MLTPSRITILTPALNAAAYERGLNYIRQLRQVVVACRRTVRFYVMDPNDPVLAVYRRAFPGVFQDLNQLSADLKMHLRYPEDLFSIPGRPVHNIPYDGSAGLL